MIAYWEERQRLGYYVVVRSWLDNISLPLHVMDSSSILDVGCFDTPTATWGHFNHRYTVDLEHDPKLPGVQSHIANFMTWKPPHRMTVVTCLQVLEHLEDEQVRPFAEKLLASGEHVIVSVPYEWKKGEEKGHKQDPISFWKFDRMMGTPPLEKLVILDGKRLRLLARWHNK